MKIIAIKLVQIVTTVFAAEFAAGLVHWFEDAYVRENTPLIGRFVGRPNTIHHHFPRYMTRHSWWQSSWDLTLLATTLVIAAWCLGLLTWQVWLFAILQDIKLLQTARHHALHHTDPKNSHYCTTTNLLNPVLDTLHFWDGLEWLLAKTIRLHRQPDTSVRGFGPGPSWLEEFRRVPAPAKR